jgi:nucleotide-binding universal stress UspA family protein
MKEVFMQALQTATSISFKNILFLTDFTEASEAALAYALGLGRHYNAQVYPAHACNPVMPAEATTPQFLESVVENSYKQLARLAKENEINGTPLFAQGSIETAFPKWIDEHGIDLVIAGTHGRRGLQRFLMGSTAEFIFRKATCPVLTVGPHVAVRPYKGFTVDNILFPTDMGTHADFAATYALSFAREKGGRLVFMHVVSMDEIFQRDRAELVSAARRKIERLVPADANEWCKPEIVIEIGDPALEVVSYAEKERPDLIVLGLPYDKRFNAHFRTGVTYKLVSSAPCPVLTIRDMATQ